MGKKSFTESHIYGIQAIFLLFLGCALKQCVEMIWVYVNINNVVVL